MTHVVPVMNENTYKMFTCQKPYSIDVSEQFKSKMPKDHFSVTTKVAIKILKNIDLKAKLKAFFSKPAVLITIGATLFAASLALSIITGGVAAPFAAIIAMKVVGVVFGLVGGFILPWSVISTCSGNLGSVSSAYTQLSQNARAQRKHLERLPDNTTVR